MAISRAMTDDKVTHGRCFFFATSPSPATFRSVVGRSRRPLATDFANLARLSNTVVKTLDSRIYAAAGDDRSQSPDVGFLEIHPVEKFGFVMCSVSIFHLVILLYFYLSANRDNCLSRPVAIRKRFDQYLGQSIRPLGLKPK